MKRINVVLQKVLMFFIVVIVASMLLPIDGRVRDLMWTDGWYYYDGDTKVDIEIPTTVYFDGDLVLMNDIYPSDSHAMMSAKLAKYNLEIECNGENLYTYKDESFPRNDQMKSKINCEISIPDIQQESTLKLTLHNTENGEFILNNIYIGSEKELLGADFLMSIPMIAISVTMIAFAVCAIFVYVSLRIVGIKDERLLNIASFFFACTIWELFDSGFAQSFSNYSALFYTLSFVAFMLLGVPFIRFVNASSELKNNHVFPLIVNIFYLNTVVQCLLCVFNVFEFIDMLFVTHIIIVLTVIYIIYQLFVTYKRTHHKDIKELLVAFGILSFFGLLSIVLYWLYEISHYEYIFEIGIILFGLCLIQSAFRFGMENSKAKTEMLIYKQLAKKDFLTGLGNRMAFEEYMLDMLSRVDALNNVLLMYLDVNHLKKVNDNFGHNVGDELIIGASDCIRASFDVGTCYRIGGDEFCILIENPKMEIKDYIENVQSHINKFNQGEERYTLSIAMGGSYLKEDGKIKTVSDWKYEADKNMYKDKGAAHHEI